jgi:hypothetical protein
MFRDLQCELAMEVLTALINSALIPIHRITPYHIRFGPGVHPLHGFSFGCYLVFEFHAHSAGACFCAFTRGCGWRVLLIIMDI